MRSYQTARTCFSILEMASWAMIVLGGLLALIGLLTAGSLSGGSGFTAILAYGTALLPAIALCFGGLLGLVYAQTSRAGVDSAEYALQGLQIARESLQVSQRALSQGTSREQGYAARTLDTPELQRPDSTATTFGGPATEMDASIPAPKAGELIEYKGRSISSDGEHFLYNKMRFQSLTSAEKYIDQLGPPMRQPVSVESKS